MAHKGWISIHRKIRENWVWDNNDPFDKRSAWIDILLMVNHKKKKFLFGNELMEVEAGERITSERKLAERWSWSRTKVRNFLELLEKDKMIEVKKTPQKRTRLKVLNYGYYQESENHKKTSKEPQENQRSTTEEPQKNLNNNDNNDLIMKNNEKEGASLSSSDRKILKILKSIDKYPFDFDRDIEQLKEYKTEFPTVDILEEVKKWKTYKRDKPLKEKSNARLQFRNWLSNAEKWSDNSASKKKTKKITADEIRNF